MKTKKKYWHTVTTLVYDAYYKADTEKNYTFIDAKDELTDRQLLNRIEKAYGVRPERISRHQVSLWAGS